MHVLDALVHQEPFECIVVCDGCTDDTVLALQKLKPSFHLSILETPGMGAAYARHQGALIARGEKLVFLDDDIMPSEKMLHAFDALVKKEKDVGIGYLLLEENDDTSWNRMYLHHWWERHFQELSKGDHVFSFQDITSGGLCLYRSFYLEQEGFDTRFKCREDYEFGYRLIQVGVRFRFSKSALGIHCDHVSDQQRLYQRKTLEGFWDVEMVRKHPELWSHCFLRSIYFTKGWMRWFIWLAFYLPSFGKQFFHLLFKRQRWLERNHLRQSWLRGEARQHRFYYALGLAKQFSSFTLFREWVDAIKRDFPLEEEVHERYDALFFAQRWLHQHHQPNRLLSEPFRRYLAYLYFKGLTQNKNHLSSIPRKVSIVVCTCDRTELLRACIDALLALDYPYKEIIVVDNAPSTDACFQLCTRLPVLYFMEPKPGLDNARNKGIAHATGEIIAFTDDDARVDKDWLTNIVSHFDDPRVMCVTGYVAPVSLERPAERTFEFNYGGMGHGFEVKRYDGVKMSNLEKLNAAGMGVGANMAFRKEWFALGGFFDPDLDVGTASGGGGDVEMFHRVVAKGCVLVYDPEVIVWHVHRRDFKGLKRQIYLNGRSFYYYLTTVYRNKTVPRWDVIRYMVTYWIWGWLLRNMVYKTHVSSRLLLYEIRGMVQASLDLQ